MKKRNEKAYLKKSVAILVSLSMLIGMNPGKLGSVNADEVDIGDPPVPAAAILEGEEIKESYATVPEAFAAVSVEETIKLYEDYTVASGETLSLNDEIEEGGVFLDLNGNTFTVNGTLSGGESTGISIYSTTPGVFNSSGNVNISLTGYTADTFNKEAFAKMKDGVILINTARGGLIDETALLDSLNTGKVYAAGLDVLREEPPRADNPLFHTDKTATTGHIAWLTKESRLRAVDMAIENFVHYLNGIPTSVIN